MWRKRNRTDVEAEVAPAAHSATHCIFCEGLGMVNVRMKDVSKVKRMALEGLDKLILGSWVKLPTKNNFNAIPWEMKRPIDCEGMADE